MGTLDHAEWLELAREGRSEDVPELLVHLLDGGVGTLAGRVEVLCDRPTDPRVAMRFAELALDPPTTASSNFPMWTKLLAYLKDAAEPSVLPIVKKRLAAEPGASKFWPKLYTGLEKVVAATGTAKPKAKAAPTKKPAAKEKAAPVDPTLAGAVAAAERADFKACLESLLAVWRETRLAAVGDAIDRVTRIVAGGLPPIPPKRWSAVAEGRTSADIARLAESAIDGKAGDAEKRMDEILGWPLDPRIGKAFLVAAYTHFFADRQGTWKRTTDLIVRNCDPRFREAIAFFAEPRGENKARMSNMRRLSRELEEALAKLPTHPSPADALQLEKLDSAIAKYLAGDVMTEEKFLADIAAAPGDDAPRLVYADWLTERGHPRGELIVLGCGVQTPEAQKRIAELCLEHPRAMLGPATAYGWNNYGHTIVSRMAEFSRGLLRYLELRFPTPRWLVTTPELLDLLEEVEMRIPAPDAAAMIRSLPQLTRLRDTGLELFAELCSSPDPLPIESLRLFHHYEGETQLESHSSSFGGVGLSNLKSLEIYWSDRGTVIDRLPDSLLASPTMAKVEELMVGTTQLNGVLAALARHGRKVRRFGFARRGNLNYRVDLEDGVATVRPQGDFTFHIKSGPLDTLRAVAASLPPGTKVTLDARITLDSPL